MYIAKAYQAGYITGYPDKTFCPENSITRAEAVVILNSILGRKADAEALKKVKSPFNDLKNSHWAYAEIIEASIRHEYSGNMNGMEVWR